MPKVRASSNGDAGCKTEKGAPWIPNIVVKSPKTRKFKTKLGTRRSAPSGLTTRNYSLSPAVIWVAERLASVAPAASGQTQLVNSGTS